MTPEARAREQIDNRLRQSGWTIQDLKQLNLTVASGVAVREFPTNTGPVDYALFIEGAPVGVVEAKKDEEGQALTDVETQSSRYANSQFKWVKREYKVRFAYEATGELVRFTDYADLKYRSRKVFSFHRPETLKRWLAEPDTVRNNLKRIPQLEESGFRKCQISAIHGLDTSFSENRPRALVQMATGAGKTFTAITAAYRLLKYGRMNRILFLVDTRSLGEQAEREFMAYKPNDDPRSFSELYGVRRLKNSYISGDVQVCISTIQRMYSILKGEELDEQAEEIPFAEYVTAESKAPKEVVYNAKIPPEFFDCIIVDECHRSIYNVWSQVLSYFDAFIIGLTATPDKRTIGYFNENFVSEYTREQAVLDGVNVGEDIYLIETDVTKNGATILKQLIERRNRLTRAKRWEQMDEDDLKVSLLRELEENPSEDGYAIVRDFLAQYPEILAAIERKTDASFTGELIEKYFAVCSVFPAQSPQAYLSTRIYDVDCPMWVLEELIGFGEFLRMYRFYAERNPQFTPLLPQRVLNPVKSLRNACAHNNCLLNALSRTSTTRPSPEISAFIASLDNISAGERRSKLTSRPMFEIVCLLYAYNKIVSPSVKKRRIKQLTEFVNGRMQRHIDYFEGPEGNKLIATSFEFLKKVVDKLN